ncbi:MFS transporter [Propionibacterium australiense]|uniref:MFS transporter n=1 Tax=Propionibacterium australiense TaxID=119981 RepID=A0A383S9M9_9ACTN|nr:MFS transporter [Propionibacterium australiense]RLP06992.1 MFS transporter [Propionibacterium australiense]RLP10800.1 MFS transporter [Propionibacterium australiense]SYZ34242.1 Major facilitator superfamily (MFS) profile [Propionibacterium australiense]VEH89912.1 Multidrug-efflux transporter 3 [Propionibacterium australiense]
MTGAISRSSGPRTSPLLVVGILAAVLTTAFESYGTLTAMPSAAAQFGRMDLYDWAFTAFMIFQVVAIVIGGRLCDRIGSVIPLAGGMSIFTVGLVAAGASVSMHMLLATRAVQGFGAGMSNVALMVLIGRVFADERKPAMMSAFSFCWVLPSFAGPPVAAFVTEHFGWHWVFWGLIPVVGFALGISWAPLMRVRGRDLAAIDEEGPDPANTPVPLWAAVCAALGAAMIQYAGHRLDLVGALVAVAGLVVLLRLAIPALMPAGFLRLGRGLPSVMAARGLENGAFIASETYLLLILTQEHGMDLGRASILLCTGSIAWAISAWAQSQRWMRGRMRRDRIIVLGAWLCTLGVAAMLVCALAEALPVPVLIVGYATGGFGMGLIASSTSLAVMALSDPAVLGRSTSSLQVSEGLLNSLITGVAGSAYAMGAGSAAWPVVFGSVLAVTTTAAAIGLVAASRIGPVHDPA